MTSGGYKSTAYLWGLTLDFTGTSQRTVDLTTEKSDIQIDGRLIDEVVVADQLFILHLLTIDEEVELSQVNDVEGLGNLALLVERKQSRVSVM